MLDDDFLAKLTILYVEDNEQLKDEVTSLLKSKFNKVLVASSIQEAQEFFSEKIYIDVIICEAFIENKNSIDFLVDVRKESENLPFIFFTEQADIDILLTSLKQDVTDFFMKPLDLEHLLLRIQEVCKVKQREDEIINEQNEVAEYLKIINKVAVVFIFDLEGNIVYANEFLKDVINCKDEEIIGHQYNAIYHYELPKKVLNEQWETINNKIQWNGKMKYLTKNSSVFYANTTILPVLDKTSGELTKFISVNFITTREEHKRRDYKRKVLYNLQETKKVYQTAQKRINELNEKLYSYKGYEKLEDRLYTQKVHNKHLYEKLQELENKLKASKRRFEQLTFGVNEKIKKISLMTSDMLDTAHKANKKTDRVREEIKVREAYIYRIKEEIDDKRVRIKDLEDVLRHRTEQLMESE
ncbi:MAG: response regulator [Campylobacterota bacterium]